MKNLKPRLLSATIFGAVVISSIYFSPISFALVFGCFLVIGIREFHQLFGIKRFHLNSLLAIILGLSFFIFSYLTATQEIGESFLLITPILSTTLFLPWLFHKTKGESISPLITITSIYYVAIPFSLLFFIGFDEFGTYQPLNILFLFFLVWANDSFAYFTGSLIGKNKLYPSVSPGKTWEGFFGGFLAALIMGYVLGVYLNDPKKWLVFAAIMSVFGTLGDLVESKMKRMNNVKDSGNLMPGHGGVLDRFDALIFALPFVFVVDLLF